MPSKNEEQFNRKREIYKGCAYENARPNLDGRGLKPFVWDHFDRVAERWGGKGSGLLISAADVIFGRPLMTF